MKRENNIILHVLFQQTFFSGKNNKKKIKMSNSGRFRVVVICEKIVRKELTKE